MKFEWEMTEEDYEALIEVEGFIKNGEGGLDGGGQDMFGNCRVGNLCADIQHTRDTNDWYSFVNLFALGEGDYGITESGTPYDLLDDFVEIPCNTKSFEEFKNKFEENFAKVILKDNKLKELAEMPLGNWN